MLGKDYSDFTPTGLLTILFFNDFCYLVGIIVEVSGTKGDEYVEFRMADGVEDVFLLDEAVRHSGTQVVEYELAVDARNGLLSGRIDLCQDDLVQL